MGTLLSRSFRLEPRGTGSLSFDDVLSGALAVLTGLCSHAYCNMPIPCRLGARTHSTWVPAPTRIGGLFTLTRAKTPWFALPTYLSPGRAAKRKKMKIRGTYLLQGPFGPNKTNLPTYLGGASQSQQTPYPARSRNPGILRVALT